ncbi:hypothetical protein ABBQ38_006808 [Trebouxia sp. C0009 RCD-2024]
MPLQPAAYRQSLLAVMTPGRHSTVLFQRILRSKTGPTQLAAAWHGEPAITAASTHSLSTSAHSSYPSQPRNQRLGQDRITSDGRLITDPQNRVDTDVAQASVDPAAVGLKRPAGVPATAPVTDPITNSQLAGLVDFVTGCKRLLVLTGAGCSTESNIPDYRGPKGAYSTGFQPMTHQQFMATEERRARYWARSFAGWHEFAAVQPNRAHHALAEMQRMGWAQSIITQNVDRLHHKAGSRDIIELHGTTHRVICMSCQTITPREEFQRQLEAMNPEAAKAIKRMVEAEELLKKRRGPLHPSTEEEITRAAEEGNVIMQPDGEVDIPVRRPDGDVELKGAGEHFYFPACAECGGILKPNVVFFGDTIPKPRALSALSLAQSCDGLLVVGSSLQVYSAFRLAKAAKQAEASLTLLTAGWTRADDIADMKIECLAGEALSRLAKDPALLVPRSYEVAAA